MFWISTSLSGVCPDCCVVSFLIYVYPYLNNECVPKSNSKFLLCFNALSEITITLQIIFHTIQNINKIFYIRSVIFSELTGKFSQYLAQFKILSTSRGRFLFISPFIVPTVLLQAISTLMSLLMACRKCIQ